MEGAMKLSDVRVVIVDRDVENLMKLRWMFEGCSYRNVACVETVEDALGLLRNNRVDILLCEIQFGGRFFQLISAIRQEFTRLQLLLLFSDEDDDVMATAAARALEVGACAFYRKSMISIEVVRDLWHHVIESSSCSDSFKDGDEIMEEIRPNSEQVMKLGKKKRKRGDDEETMMMGSSGELSIRSGFINIRSKRIMGAAAAASKKKKNTLLIRLNNNNTTAAASDDHQEEEDEMICTPTPTPTPSSSNSDSVDCNSYSYNTVLLQDYWDAAVEEDSSMLLQDYIYWSDADIEELTILDNIPQLRNLASLF